MRACTRGRASAAKRGSAFENSSNWRSERFVEIRLCSSGVCACTWAEERSDAKNAVAAAKFRTRETVGLDKMRMILQQNASRPVLFEPGCGVSVLQKGDSAPFMPLLRTQLAKRAFSPMLAVI